VDERGQLDWDAEFYGKIGRRSLPSSASAQWFSGLAGVLIKAWCISRTIFRKGKQTQKLGVDFAALSRQSQFLFDFPPELNQMDFVGFKVGGN
jgi:hypothetical protein